MSVYRAFALPMGVEQVVPSRLLVFPKGEPPSNDGRLWRFEDADLEEVVAAFGQRTEPLPVLYAHGEDQAKGKKAAGWVDSIALEADGIWANVRWTEVAREEIRAGEWGFRSPGFEGWEDAEGRVHPAALSEVSLVNDPAIGAMPPVQASTAARDGENEKEVAQMATNTEPVNAAKKAAALAFDKAGILSLVRDAFKIPEPVDDSMLEDLVCKALETGESPVDESTDEPSADPMAPAAASDAPAPFPPIPAVAATEPKKCSRAEAEGAVKKYQAAGKILPAQAVDALRLAEANLEAFVAHMEAAPVVTPASGQLVTASATDRTQQNTAFAAADLSDPGKRVELARAARKLMDSEQINAETAYARLVRS